MDKKTLWIIVIAVIIVLAIVIGISFSGRNILGSPYGCSDSDGVNITNAGYLDFKGYQIRDICLSDAYVHEAKCAINTPTNSTAPGWTTYKCPKNTFCNNGACVRQGTVRCYNDDGCGSTTTKYCSNTSAACTTTTYYQCVNPGTLNSTCAAVGGSGGCTICSNGCSNGECIPSNQTCTDSDGGLNIYEFGRLVSSNGSIFVDWCFRGGYREPWFMSEAYCLPNGNGNYTTLSCPLNYTCSNGACTMTTNQTNNTGNLYVTSTPSNANVSVSRSSAWTGNDYLNQKTPITFYNLSVGNHLVILTKEGYRNYSTTSYIYAGQTTTLSVTLNATNSTGGGGGGGGNSTQVGHLSVYSVPSNASVRLDYVTRGVTPLTLYNISVGSHWITLIKTGYETWTSNVSIYAGQYTVISQTLTTNSTGNSTG